MHNDSIYIHLLKMQANLQWQKADGGCLQTGRREMEKSSWGVAQGTDYKERSLRKIGVCEKYIHYLDCVDGFTIVCVYQTFQIVHFKHMQIILHQLHISKASKNHSGQFSWPIMHSFNGSILSHHDTPLFVQHFQAIYSFVFCLFG